MTFPFNAPTENDWRTEYTIQKEWAHPRMPGMHVTRVLKVYTPHGDKAALKISHVHFVMALGTLGIHFERFPHIPGES